MSVANHILVVNVGSTSIKLAVFVARKCLHEWSLPYGGADGADAFIRVMKSVASTLEEHGYDLDDFAAISARSGILKPVSGGTYLINSELLADVGESRFGQHASNLSPQVAQALSEKSGIPAYVVDPISTDELDPALKLTGVPWIERKSLFHALSQKAAARKAALEIGRKYDKCNIIVAHMGGGISVGAHRSGRVVDVGNAIGGDGPMAPERAGSAPAVPLIEACFSGRYKKEEIMKAFAGGGGVLAHLGTRDMREVDKRTGQGDQHAESVFESMTYSITKAIGARAAVLKGNVDSIVLTGGLSSWLRLVREIENMVNFIAPVRIYTRNLEMEALALGALRVLEGSEQALEYPAD